MYTQYHDRRTIITGTGQLFMARKARTAAEAIAQGFEDFQLVDEIQIIPKSETRDKYVTNRGRKVLGKSSNRMIDDSYETTLGQLGYRNLGILYHGNPDYDWGAEAADNAQTGLSAVAGTAWNFNTGSSGVANVVGRWYPIRAASGTPHTDITACTFAGALSAYGSGGASTTLAEGIDYVLDKKLGMVQFKKSISNDTITPTITSKTISATSKEYLKKIKPGQLATIDGIFRVLFWDDEDDSNLAFHHQDFYGRLSANGGPTANDDFMSLKVTIKVIQPGIVLARPDAEF